MNEHGIEAAHRKRARMALAHEVEAPVAINNVAQAAAVAEGRAAVAAMLDGLELFGMGYSWGGFESLAIPFDCAAMRSATGWAPGGPTVLRVEVPCQNPSG